MKPILIALLAMHSIASAQNLKPVTKPDTVILYQDRLATFNVLANDKDPNGDPISVTSFYNNTTQLSPSKTATITNVGALTIASNGLLTFNPELLYLGTYSGITYMANDGKTGSAKRGYVVLIVKKQPEFRTATIFSNDSLINPPIHFVMASKDTTTNPTKGFYHCTINGYYGKILTKIIEGRIYYEFTGTNSKGQALLREMTPGEMWILSQYSVRK